MGFLRSLKELHDIGKEQRKNFSVQDQLANAKASMAQASAAMSLARPVQNSTEATATITSMRETGTIINSSPLIEFELLVQLPGGVPTPVTTTSAVPLIRLASTQPGQRINVLVNPDQLTERAFIDWTRVA